MQPRQRGSYADGASRNPRRLSFRECSTVLIHKQLPNGEELKGIPRPPHVDVSTSPVGSRQLSKPSSRASSRSTPGTPGSLLEERASFASEEHVALEEDAEWTQDSLVGGAGMGDFGDEDDDHAPPHGAGHSVPRMGRFSEQLGLQALLIAEEDEEDEEAEEDEEEGEGEDSAYDHAEATVEAFGRGTSSARARGIALEKKSTLTYGVYPWRKSTRQGKPNVNHEDDDDDLDLGLSDDDDNSDSDRTQQEEREATKTHQEQEQEQEQGTGDQVTGLKNGQGTGEEPHQGSAGTETAEEDVCEKENHSASAPTENSNSSNKGVSKQEATTAPVPASEPKQTARRFRVCEKTGALDDEFKHLYERVDNLEVSCFSQDGTTNITLPVCFI